MLLLVVAVRSAVQRQDRVMPHAQIRAPFIAIDRLLGGCTVQD